MTPSHSLLINSFPVDHQNQKSTGRFFGLRQKLLLLLLINLDITYVLSLYGNRSLQQMEIAKQYANYLTNKTFILTFTLKVIIMTTNKLISTFPGFV